MSLLGSPWRLSTAATYCPGSFGCCSSRHGDHLGLCCHGDGCRACLYAGGSRPSCAADGGWKWARRRSADSCPRGRLGADRGCYDAAWRPSVPISHLQAASAGWTSRCLAAACGADARSSGGEGEEKVRGAAVAFWSDDCGAYSSVLLQAVWRRVGPLDQGWRSVGWRVELDRAPARVAAKSSLFRSTLTKRLSSQM